MALVDADYMATLFLKFAFFFLVTEIVECGSIEKITRNYGSIGGPTPSLVRRIICREVTVVSV